MLSQKRTDSAFATTELHWAPCALHEAPRENQTRGSAQQLPGYAKPSSTPRRLLLWLGVLRESKVTQAPSAQGSKPADSGRAGKIGHRSFSHHQLVAALTFYPKILN
ncbi:hypothetical protein KIL84_005260 [Mauremys mutica]|uniref:Uncharacterized protein n=1 Tax=Mauremys mutica TaxID=74926 RepID=A0A9D3XJ54_9SAUR|nr:hypothetical protein KIL84_005260 [Mauremys mutica]